MSTLPNLISLNAEHNNIKDWKAFNVEEGWKTLRTLKLSYNKISELIPIAIANLTELYLTENRIEKMEGFGGHAKIKVLELRRNKINNLQGLGGMAELTDLYLAENKIKSLAGLEAPNLKRLHLRKNIVFCSYI